MQLRDPAFWTDFVEKNSDHFYSRNVVNFCERWASLMEEAMGKGQVLEEVARDLANKADTSGITLFQYGIAVSALSSAWAHGEQLRRWHNAESGVEEDKAKGGVVNLAMWEKKEE